MTAKTLLRLMVVAGGVLLMGGANGADLAGNRGGACVSYTQSTLPLLPQEEIKQTAWANFEAAEAGMNDPGVQASRNGAFVWAMETRWACTAALGYLKTGYLDEESVQKCDCFHQRYMSLR